MSMDDHYSYCSCDESFLVPWTRANDVSIASSAAFEICEDGLARGIEDIYGSSGGGGGGGGRCHASTSNNNSHSQAEKRRRDRINKQLGILRKLIPKSEKMDKAGLLRNVIDSVKDLKREAMEVCKGYFTLIPTEVDHVNVSVEESDGDNQELIRARICCDDRPELFSELVRVLKHDLRLGIVKADICSVGGRVQGILLLSSNNSNIDNSNNILPTIQRSLHLLLARIASSSTSSSNMYPIRSKRQRFFLTSHH